MNADDQNLVQPENRENEDDERLVMSEPSGEESESEAATRVIQPPDEILEEATPDEESESEAAEPAPPVSETPNKTALNSAVPPRIVSETPLGGSPRTRTVASPEPSAGATVDRYEIDDTTKEIPPRLLGRKTLRPPAGEAVDRSAPTTPTPSDAVEPTTAEPVAKPAPAKPEQPPSRVTHSEPPARPDDWADEDLSPELAAVLFGEHKPQVEAPSAPDEAPAPAPVQVSAPEIAAEPPAESIALTDVSSARRLRLTAEAHSAAAPESTLQGKVRYVRIEEPFNNGKGQRISESWRYFKPDYPSLEGRLVKAVESAEIQYADGSWYWKYERRYTDGGRDRRVVCANTDRSYVERHDEVSKLAAQAGKRVLYKEDAAMILAESEREERHGFLSGLLGRDDSVTASDSAKAWREATPAESRHARKNGGEALRRRFLGIF